MFLVVSVCSQGSNVIITHDALNFTKQVCRMDLAPHPTPLMKRGSQNWRPAQTCSLQEPP